MRSKGFSNIERFLRGETTAGLILMAAAALALLVANSPAQAFYEALWERPLGFAAFHMTVLHWINDGLMALFFLLVGLEIKREIVGGELSTRAKAALPVIAALGGMIGPALIYLAFNRGNPADLRGWAIPTATDIAFALGILTLLGKRVPASLKIFLTALAIIDDLGAVAIIAVFYTAQLSWPGLTAAAACVAVLVVLNRMNVRRIWPYLGVGLLLWVAVLSSGVHATMAGVMTAMAVPAAARDTHTAPLTRLEHALHPFVTFLILPLFAFANAGVALADVTPDLLLNTVTLGIAVGLFVGKQAGVLAAVAAARRFRLVQLPGDVTPAQLYGVAVLTGVGFTMSLFIGALAFTAPLYQAELKIGVLGGSLASGIAGYLILRLSTNNLKITDKSALP